MAKFNKYGNNPAVESSEAPQAHTTTESADATDDLFVSTPATTEPEELVGNTSLSDAAEAPAPVADHAAESPQQAESVVVDPVFGTPIPDPSFGTHPASVVKAMLTPHEEEPVQADKPSYAQLVEAARKHQFATVRVIRTRPSNQHMVGTVCVSRELNTFSLDSVLERGESALRDLATDDTVEVIILPLAPEV